MERPARARGLPWPWAWEWRSTQGTSGQACRGRVRGKHWKGTCKDHNLGRKHEAIGAKGGSILGALWPPGLLTAEKGYPPSGHSQVPWSLQRPRIGWSRSASGSNYQLWRQELGFQQLPVVWHLQHAVPVSPVQGGSPQLPTPRLFWQEPCLFWQLTGGGALGARVAA